VMDSNVNRVIARLEAIETPLDRSDTQARIRTTLEDLLAVSDSPGQLSEAFMELGALVCKSGAPECGRCPLTNECEAYQRDLTSSIPKTAPRSERAHHEIAVGVIVNDHKVLISRRPEDKMLGGLWEFPGGKVEDGESLQEALVRELHEELGIEVSVVNKMMEVPHAYSHMTINLHAYRCRIVDGAPSSEEGQRWEWVDRDELEEYAFPKANKQIVDDIINETSEV
jgi:A/G-specific adenine glycosylase